MRAVMNFYHPAQMRSRQRVTGKFQENEGIEEKLLQTASSTIIRARWISSTIAVYWRFARVTGNARGCILVLGSIGRGNMSSAGNRISAFTYFLGADHRWSNGQRSALLNSSLCGYRGLLGSPGAGRAGLA